MLPKQHNLSSIPQLPHWFRTTTHCYFPLELLPKISTNRIFNRRLLQMPLDSKEGPTSLHLCLLLQVSFTRVPYMASATLKLFRHVASLSPTMNPATKQTALRVSMAKCRSSSVSRSLDVRRDFSQPKALGSFSFSSILLLRHFLPCLLHQIIVFIFVARFNVFVSNHLVNVSVGQAGEISSSPRYWLPRVLAVWKIKDCSCVKYL